MRARLLIILSVSLCLQSLIAGAEKEAGSGDVDTKLQVKDSVKFTYSGTNLFLDLIRGLKSPAEFLVYHAEIMSAPGDRIPFRYIQPVLKSYVGFLVCLIIGITFIILMPLVGLIFCCARCCGKCGGRVQLMDARKDPCRRVFYTIFAVLIVAIQMVAIGSAFINHILLHEALVNQDPRLGAIPQINSSLQQTEDSLKEMFRMASNSTSVDLEDRKLRFMSTIDRGLNDLQREFVRSSRADSVLSTIRNLQKTMLQFNLNSEAHTQLTFFNTSISELIHQLPPIRDNIVEILDPNCPYESIMKCRDLMVTAQTQLNVRYTMDDFQSAELTQVLDALHEVQPTLDELNEFNLTLNRMASVVKQAVQNDLDQAWSDLAYSPATREKLANNFAVYLDEIYAVLNKARSALVSEETRESREAFFKIVEFRFYGGLALLCIPVLILLLASLGLCFGTCGHRPYEEAGLCNRGVGANLLLAAVGFIFLFSTLLMIVCTILFLVGAPVQTEACRYLTGHVPDGPRKLDDYVHESLLAVVEKVRREIKIHQRELARERLTNPYGPQTTVQPSYDLTLLETLANITGARLTDAVLTRCETEPFIDAVSSGQFTMPVLYESVQDILRGLLQSIRNVDLLTFFQNTIDGCKQSLRQMAFADTINFTRAMNQADMPLTHIDNLEQFESELRNLNLSALNPQIDRLNQYATTVDKRRRQVRHWYTKLNSIPAQRQELERFLGQFSEQLSEALSQSMDSGFKQFQPLLSQELQLALIATWRNIPCRSLRIAVKGGIDAVCVTLLMPLNALWAALGIVLLLFIPLIVFAVKLAGLYRKTEKYSSDYEEPDYISYHGFYIRPTADQNAASKNSRNKKRHHKGNSATAGPTSRNSKFRSGSQSRYHQVSVYPYDAYE